MRIRLACAAGLLLYVPITVLALGLGPMQTNSSLNEPFDAKVPLVDAKVEELDTLKVGLANRAQFKRAGLEYTLPLSDLRFELVQPKAGSDYIRIWSKEPVREPVLDFLLEVNWLSGRLIREFTVLLDPPRYEATPSVAPHRPAATVAPRPQATHSPPAVDTNTGGASDQYGPTRAGDTLWEIAQGTRSGEVSMQQMMLALLEANPNAFINANINLLKQGQILRIPQASALSSHTQAQALAEVRRHNALWEEYRQRLASSVPERSVGAEGSQGTALGGEEKQPAPAEEARLEVLGAAASAVEKSEGGAAGKGEPGPAAGAEPTQLVAEESQAVAQDENAHLRQRLKESESLVELMRRQVQLKDDELAALQAKLAQAGTAVPEAVPMPPTETIEGQPGATEAGAETTAGPQVTEVPVPTEPTATEPLAEAGPAAAPNGETTESAAPAQPEGATLSAGAPTEPLLPEPGEEAQEAAEPIGEAGVPAVIDSQETAETASPSAVQAPVASAEPGGLAATAAGETPQEGAAVADTAPPEDAPLIPGGIYSMIGLIAVAGLLVFWVFWRIRAKSQGAKDEDEFTGEVPFQPAGLSGYAAARPDQDEEAPVLERTLEDVQKRAHGVEAELEEEGERTRFPTELAAEKDPLEEVNLCIAYERFDEAEQLVKKVIAVHPGRHDYKLRLLEVYYAAGNKGAYERAARELNAAVGGQGPLWDNAIAMWYEMSPERPLFAERSGEDDQRHFDMDAQREVLDITSVRGGEAWKSKSSSERAGLEMASALDFDLGATQEKELATPVSDRGRSEEAGEYTDVFDLSSPEDAASEGIVDVTMVGESTGEEGQLFDLTAAETTSGGEDVLDLTAVDGQRGVDQEMLDLTVADNAANADEILDLTTAGSGYEEDGLDFDITGGHEVPETTEESDDALHLTVPKASFPSAKPPEPKEQVFEITHPTERSEGGAANRSLEIGQETVELPRSKTPPGADVPDEVGIQTVDLFHYFQKGGSGDDTSPPDTPQSSVKDAVPEAAESSPFVVSVDNENSEVGDAETDLAQSNPGLLIGSDEGSRDAAEGERNSWEATGEENEWGETTDVPSLSEHRSQQSSWQDQGAFVEGETSQEQAPWSAYRDSAQGVQNEARTPPEEREKAEAGHGQSLASSEHVGPSLPEGKEELETKNVEQNVTMSNTVQLPQHALATGSGGASAAGENDFVVIADLTAPEEVVAIDLSEKTQEIGDTQENDRFAHTVRLPRAFPTAAGEPGDLDTKLNLAKAYIELGDPKGARAILDEVAHSGSDVQKQHAETLRRQLG